MHWQAWTWLEAKVPVRKGSRYTLNLAGNLVHLLLPCTCNNVAGWTEGQYFKSIYYFNKSIYDIYVYIYIYTIVAYSDYMWMYI